MIEKVNIKTSTEFNISKYSSGYYLFKLYNEKQNETHTIRIEH